MPVINVVYKIVPPIRDRTFGVTAVRAIQSEVYTHTERKISLFRIYVLFRILKPNGMYNTRSIN